MNRIARPEVAPKALRSEQARQARREMLEFMTMHAAKREQSNPPAPSRDHPSLLRALSQITRGRCAFCEGKADLLLHRIRPAGGALPLAGGRSQHLYYFWLADAWQNLLPTCAACQPRLPHFPVVYRRAPIPSEKLLTRYVESGDGLWPNAIAEEPLLLDPSADVALENHLCPMVNGALAGITVRGRATVGIYSLDREDLIERRRAAYSDRLTAIEALVSEGRTDPAPWAPLFAFVDLEFGGTWYYLLKRIGRVLERARDGAPRLSRQDIVRVYRALAEHGGTEGLSRLRDAIAEVAAEEPKGRARRPREALPRAEVRPATVAIRNFKSIGDLTLTFPALAAAAGPDDPVPSLLILGENSTGKSSALEALALALSTDAARWSLDISWNKLKLDPQQLGVDAAGSPRETVVEVLFEGHDYTRLQVFRDGFEADSSLTDRELPVFAYSAFRRFDGGSLPPAPAMHIRNLFDNEPLSNPERWLLGLDAERRNAVVRALRDLLSIDGDFEVIQRSRRAKRLEMVTLLPGPGGTPVEVRTPLQSVSSGYRAMLAMLCDIMRGLVDRGIAGDFEGFQSAQGVVLIDEIEAHLHPRWKMQVMTSLRRALPNVTFVVTTHDPLCLRGMRNGEVVVLQRAAGRTAEEPVRIEQLRDLPDITTMRIEQLLTSDLFQLFSTDDAQAERGLAQVADLLARRRESPAALNDDERALLAGFERDIAAALPVGSSEVQRIVQEAVAEFLAKRRDESAETLATLREDTRRTILQTLESL